MRSSNQEVVIWLRNLIKCSLPSPSIIEEKSRKRRGFWFSWPSGISSSKLEVMAQPVWKMFGTIDSSQVCDPGRPHDSRSRTNRQRVPRSLTRAELSPKPIMGTFSPWTSVFGSLSEPTGMTLGQFVGHFIWAVGNNRIEITTLGVLECDLLISGLSSCLI